METNHSFCPDSFWNDSVTWDTNRPRLTECFQDTVMLGLPCLMLWILTPFWLHFIFRRRSSVQFPLPKQRHFTVWGKFLALFGLFFGIAYKLKVSFDTFDQVFPSNVIGQVVMMVTYVLVGFIMGIERKLSVHTSPLQFYFWTIHFFTSLPQFVRDAQDLSYDEFSPSTLISLLFGFPLVLLQLVLHTFSDISTSSGDGARPPENTSSHLNVLLFSWMDKLIFKGYKEPLIQSELPTNPEHVDVSMNVKEFLSRWNSTLVNKGVSMYKKSDDDKIVSIWPVLFRTYGGRLLVSTLLGALHSLIGFANPLVLDRLIKHITDKNEEEWKGYFYIGTLFFCNLVWTLSCHMSLHQLVIVGVQMRSSVVSAIYQKALKISNKARAKYTIGEITNYMSVDAQRILETIPYVPHLIMAPISVIISMAFLYHYLDTAALGGIAVLAFLFPINFWGSRKSEQLQDEQLTAKDSRIKLMNEILPGIKVLKLYAWELPFMKRVNDVRAGEIRILKYLAKLWALTNFTFACSPFLVTVAVFTMYTLFDPVNHVLDASKIFVSMSLFGLMRLPLTIFPWALTETIKLIVSLKRINRFLNAEELDPDAIGSSVKNDANVVELKNASFAWGDSEQLHSIDLDIKQGSLTAVVGQVGSGKSSLLQAILGEMDLTSGTADRKSQDLKIAYVAQQAWIQNLTLKDNILFSNPFNRREYAKAIEACALQPDLDMLTNGDNTEIGENGINLSGGQKQRVSIARAVYSNSDLYLLDDPLSAVDAHVGKHLFEKVFHSRTGALKDKTRVLATNSLHVLKDVDQIIVMANGTISERGNYRELLAKKGAFAEYLKNYLKNEVHVDVDIEDLSDVDKIEELAKSIPAKEPIEAVPAIGIPGGRRTSTLCSDSILGTTPNSMRLLGRSFETTESAFEAKPYSRRNSRRISTSIIDESPEETLTTRQVLETDQEPNDDDEGRLIEDEAALTGRVKWGVYHDYAKSVGVAGSLMAVLFYALGQGLHSFSNVWLSFWSDYNQFHNQTEVNNKLSFYLGIYAGLGGVESLIEFTRDMMLFLCCARASKILHQRLLRSVMRSPMSFFDTNPTGRIVNRFSADIDKIDLTIPFLISDFLFCLCEVIAIICIVSYSTPSFLYVILPLFVVYFFIQRYYIKSSRQLKRLESISKSPIFSHFTESVTGATTIRAFGQANRFTMESEAKVDANVRCNYYNYCSNRWLAIRIETLGNVIIFFAALFAILDRDNLTPGKAGLSISYAMQVTDTLTWMVRMLCDLETNCVALERVLEYINGNPQEAEWEGNKDDNLENWPTKGCIDLINYETRYRPGLDLVLKGITLNVGSEMKVGICGRTGAGKSSLTLALFRIIEAASGRIVIDGKDISKLGLHQLRSRLTIIPQDPVLFTGDVRFNLDPTGKRNDDELWQALEHAHLKNHVKLLAGGLDHEVNEGGANFSVGQRQLMCLARALLRKTKILVLDEATAAIDMETDDLIQKTIRREFKECTVITIAHRLNTILDSDAIAVLSEGKLIEFDNPSVLLEREDSALRLMAKDANIAI